MHRFKSLEPLPQKESLCCFILTVRGQRGLTVAARHGTSCHTGLDPRDSAQTHVTRRVKSPRTCKQPVHTACGPRCGRGHESYHGGPLPDSEDSRRVCCCATARAWGCALPARMAIM
eukprot:3331228-Rhodomonas_salina.1